MTNWIRIVRDEDNCCFAGLDGEVWIGEESAAKAARRESFQKKQHDEQKVNKSHLMYLNVTDISIVWPDVGVKK